MELLMTDVALNFEYPHGIGEDPMVKLMGGGVHGS
jgi:hypothetical protein